ncbi:MAG: hypothetical protein ACTHKQ_02285 [Mesorhizobium sp.]
MNQRLLDFASRVSAEQLREVDEAVALLWFLTHVDGQVDSGTASEIATLLRQLRLRSNVNVSRLNKNLLAHRDTVRGLAAGTIRIKASKDKEFIAKYGEFTCPKPIVITDELISNDIPLGGRKYLEEIRREANGCYQFELYSGAAVMCRRLTEMLMVDAFEKAGHLSGILDGNGNIKPFSEIISAAQSKNFIRLSRTSPGIIDKVKAVGDAGAHHRFYISKKKDLDELNPGLRHILTELATLAGY